MSSDTGATAGPSPSPAVPSSPAVPPATMIATVPGMQATVDEAPFHHLVRMIVEEVNVDTGRFVLRLPFHASLTRLASGDQVHGGPIASVIDTAGTFAVTAVVGHGVPTMNLRIDYLRPAFNTDLVATATVRRSGRSAAVCDIDLHDDQGRLVAVGRGTWSTAAG